MAHEARSERARLNRLEHAPVVAAAGSRSLAGAALTLPPLVLLGLALLLAFRGGGVIPEEWAPISVGTAIGLAVLGAVGSLPRIPRHAWPPLLALAGFVAWSAVSIAWSVSPEATVESVARLSLVLLAALVGASYAARVSAAQAVGIALAAAGAILTVTAEVKLLAGSTAMFSETRLAWPIDYANGAAALFFLALPPLLAAAATERARPLGRAVAGSVAALALSEGVMTLSRGAAIALVATLVVCVLLSTERGRFALTLGAVLVPIPFMWTRLTGGRPAELAADASTRGWAAAAAMGGAAILVALLASLEHAAPRLVRKHEGAFAVTVWTAAAVVGASAFAVHSGRPDTWISARWDEFSHPAAAHSSDASRFGNATSNRYDYWRVAARSFEAHPLGGEGEGAFAVPWFRHRAVIENVTDPHSWEAESLADTGLVGFLLLAAALVLPLAQLARARGDTGAFTAVALGGSVAYFILHGSFDWLLLIPAVALPAGVALGASAAGGRVPDIKLSSGRQRAAVAVGALLVGVGALPLYFSSTLTARAEGQSVTSTQRAVDTLDLAARANPWAVQPFLTKTAILLGASRPGAAVAAAKKATRREPSNWTAWLSLADAERMARHRRAAAAALRHVHALNPLYGP